MAVSTKKFARQRKNEGILKRAWKRSLAGCEYHILEEERRLLLPEEQAMSQKQNDALIASHYHNRVGRALLRGRNWHMARKHYISSARKRPAQFLAYFGVVRSILHIGGVNEHMEWAGDWPPNSQDKG
jgi:hypothetical protein